MTTNITSTTVLEMLSRQGFETIRPTETTGQLRLVGRVAGQYSDNWKVVILHLLQAAERNTWAVDVSRQYFPREGQLFYAWRLIFQGENLHTHYGSIVQTLANAPKARFEVKEQALPGVTGQRSMQNSRGKGAAPAGSVPLLVRQRGGMG